MSCTYAPGRLLLPPDAPGCGLKEGEVGRLTAGNFVARETVGVVRLNVVDGVVRETDFKVVVLPTLGEGVVREIDLKVVVLLILGGEVDVRGTARVVVRETVVLDGVVRVVTGAGVVVRVVAGLPTVGGFGMMIELSIPSVSSICFWPGRNGGMKKLRNENGDGSDDPGLDGTFCPFTTLFPCESV